MSERTAKRLRREHIGLPKPKQFFKPLTFERDGEEIYIPRTQRRKLMRQYMKALRKGKVDFNGRTA